MKGPNPRLGAVFVEIVRLLIVLMTTAAGYAVGAGADPTRPVLGATLGASAGYVAGGVIGRGVRRAMGHLEDRAERWDAPTVLVGGLGACVTGVTGAVVAAPAIVLLPPAAGWPLVILTAWICAYGGFRISVRKSEQLLNLVGLTSTPMAPATTVAHGPIVVVDSSAVIDGRIGAIAAAGFLSGTLVVAPFVLDELQGLADAADPLKRRRGRRALELLDHLRQSDAIRVTVSVDEVPEHVEVDAKLVTLAQRLGASLLTTDRALARVAELRGIRCLDPASLSGDLQADYLPGERVRVPISRTGKEPGQGVGYLEDGTMVVVTDAAELVGSEVDVRLSSPVETSVGRMFFGALERS